MTKEQEKAIEQLRSWREYIVKNKEKVNKANDIEFYLRTALNLIQTQQEELEKKNKIIDLMTQYIGVDDIEENDDIDLCDFLSKSYSDCKYLSSACEDCIKQYFERKI